MGLAFERHGSGPPLVLPHGVGHRRQAWGAVLERLTARREVVAVDLPGHGELPPLRSAGRPVVDALLHEVVGLFDELALERPHLAGNSLGGRLALEAAGAGRAATVTALSPVGFWRGDGQARRAGAVSKTMEFGGARLQPLAPALSRSTAGRAGTWPWPTGRPSASFRWPRSCASGSARWPSEYRPKRHQARSRPADHPERPRQAGARMAPAPSRDHDR